MCRFLEQRGFTVESATNGQEALETLQRIAPDIIVTDMQMPKMSGSELINPLLEAAAGDGRDSGCTVAGKQSGFDKTEKRADFAIYKDIDIEDQLGNVLDALLGEKDASKTARTSA